MSSSDNAILPAVLLPHSAEKAHFTGRCFFAGKAHQVGQAERPFTRGIWHMVHDPGKGS